MVAACSAPPPRDAAYFAGHPEAARNVLLTCQSGARTLECEPARAGLARRQAQARKARYRKGSE